MRAVDRSRAAPATPEPQPQLDLAPGAITPDSETALRAAYELTNWRRRGISCARALASPALRTILRIRAEIAARKR